MNETPFRSELYFSLLQIKGDTDLVRRFPESIHTKWARMDLIYNKTVNSLYQNSPLD